MMKTDQVNPAPIWPALSFVTAILLVLTMMTGISHSSEKPTASLRFDNEFIVGQPVTAIFDLDGYTIPNGSYASINIRVISMPGDTKPRIKTGYPHTKMIFHTPGEYTLNFILNQMSKPSCGGVDAKLLLETTRTITVTTQ